VSGQMVREGFLKAYYANPAKAAEQTIKFYDTNTASMNALSQQAVAEGAEFIVGPLTKENVQQLIGTTPPKLPILALNYTEGPLPTHFYEFGLRPEDESAQMAKKARQAGYSKALIIAPQNAWGNRIAPNFASSWQTLGGNVKDTFYFTPQSALNQEVARLLTARKGQADFDVIFLFAQPTASRKIVPLLRQHLLNPNTPIYASASVYSGNPNSIKDKNLNGIIICDIPWRKNTGQSARLFAVGKDAYLLSKNMPQLVQLPHFAIYGNTGALSLTSQQQVHRSLPCRAFANGLLS